MRTLIVRAFFYRGGVRSDVALIGCASLGYIGYVLRLCLVAVSALRFHRRVVWEAHEYYVPHPPLEPFPGSRRRVVGWLRMVVYSLAVLVLIHRLLLCIVGLVSKQPLRPQQ